MILHLLMEQGRFHDHVLVMAFDVAWSKRDLYVSNNSKGDLGNSSPNVFQDARCRLDLWN